LAPAESGKYMYLLLSGCLEGNETEKEGNIPNMSIKN
jgi:hypothetical protein